MKILVLASARGWRSRAAIGLAGIAATALGAAAVGLSTAHPAAGQALPMVAVPSPDSFKPTEAQWKSLRIAPVAITIFRSDSITKGNIAIDDDLNTPDRQPGRLKG